MSSVLLFNIGSQVQAGQKVGRAAPTAAASGTSSTRRLVCQSACAEFQAYHQKCYLLSGGYIKDCTDEAGEGNKSTQRNKWHIVILAPANV